MKKLSAFVGILVHCKVLLQLSPAEGGIISQWIIFLHHNFHQCLSSQEHTEFIRVYYTFKIQCKQDTSIVLYL